MGLSLFYEDLCEEISAERIRFLFLQKIQPIHRLVGTLFVGLRNERFLPGLKL